MPKQNNIDVSVLVPIYNMEQYLPTALNSLAAQTLSACEFICIDDGSADGSAKIMNSYAAKDPRFKIEHQENAGYGAALNKALALARGTYIGILEPDDFAEPEMYETLLAAAHTYNCEIVRSNRFNYASGKSKFREQLAGLPYNTVFRPVEEPDIFLAPPAIWSALYSRQMLADNAIEFIESPGAAFQDTSFVYKSLVAAQRVVLLESAFLHYRTDNKASSVHNPGKVFAICDELAEVDNFIHSTPNIPFEFMLHWLLTKYDAWHWNYLRLTENERPAFIARISKELKTDANAGHLSKEVFGEQKWEEAQQLMKSPRSFKLWDSTKPDSSTRSTRRTTNLLSHFKKWV